MAAMTKKEETTMAKTRKNVSTFEPLKSNKSKKLKNNKSWNKKKPWWEKWNRIVEITKVIKAKIDKTYWAAFQEPFDFFSFENNFDP